MVAADRIDVDLLNTLDTASRGLVYLCLTDERCAQLGLEPLARNLDESHWETKLTPSISHRGAADVSIGERWKTIRVVLDPATRGHDLFQPGGILVLRTAPGGVLQRAGQAEAAVDLARLAGLTPAGVMCSLVNDDGSLKRAPGLLAYARRHRLPVISIPDVITHRRRTEKLVERVAAARLPTETGDFTATAFIDNLTGEYHLALVKGDVAGRDDVLVRVHTRCFGGEVFQALDCGCGELLATALNRISKEGSGVLVYLIPPLQNGEPPDVGACGRLGAESPPPGSALDVPGEPAYAIGSQILADLGLSTIRVLTDPGSAAPAIEGFGLEIVAHVPLQVDAQSS